MAFYLTLATLLLTLLGYKLIYGWLFARKKMRDIPGPKGWPFVGNSFQMDPIRPYKTFIDWSSMYGNIFKIKIFQEDAVVLNDFESIREVLMSEACSARPYSYRGNEILLKDWTGIVFRDFTPEWNERKKILARSVNAYNGAGKMKIESITMDSIHEMFANIVYESEHYTRSFDMRSIVHKCTAGIFTTLWYGKKLEESELNELIELERGINKLLSPAGLIAILNTFSWARFFPITAIQGLIHDAENVRKWISQKYHEMRYTHEDELDGVYHSLMKYVNKVTKKVMTKSELLGVSADSVVAGFPTSSAAMCSLILVLINYPELQDKMHEEIEQVTNGRRPEISDQRSMPYARAVIEENFRFSTTVPLPGPHLTTVDTIIGGKFIPKGTTLNANVWKLHHDEKLFKDPWNFKPECYLTSDGQMLASDHPIWKYTMPFSAGRRKCPGETLARPRLFLLLVSLMQRYKFLPEDDENIPACDPINYDSGLVTLPYRYKVRVSKR